jgi:hypothetical protein
MQAFLGCGSLKGPLEIPDQVVEIGYDAFRGCASLNGELVLPDSLKIIGQGAFQECSGFTGRLIIPDSVTRIEPYAFARCSSLDGPLILPEHLSSIGASAFAECSRMSGELLFGDSLEEIGPAAFLRCSGIQGGLTFPNNLRIIGASAFAECSELTGELSLPESLRIIGSGAFKNCSGLTGDISLPDEIEELSFGCFEGCSGFDGVLHLPRNLKTISTYALKGCNGLHGDLIIPDQVESIPLRAFAGFDNFDGRLVLPRNLKEIGEGAFYGCSGFRGELVIPEGVETIPLLAFYGCSQFENLSLPSTIKTIGRDAFRDCKGLKTVRIAAITPPECQGVFLDCGYPMTPTYHYDGDVYVPESSVETYIQDAFWGQYYGRYNVEGHSPQEYFRTSTDFSRDGEVVLLQKATKGNGVNLILMGDGFLDVDMNPGGKYEQVLRKYMDQFFKYEPYRSLRDRFNVYAVKVVSENDVFFSKYARRKFIDDNNGDPIYSSGFDYTKKVPNNQNNPRLTCSAVILNYNYSYGRSFCTQFYGSTEGSPFWDSLSSESYILEPIETRPTMINHEMGGHGFAMLDDEYTEYDQTISSEYKKELDEFVWLHVNIDWRKDPNTVKWSHFLKDSRYDEEKLGLYEGGDVFFPKGVFRPSENSLMRNDQRQPNAFNAPSREQIYKTTMTLSEGSKWTYNYNVFALFDEAGRKEAAEACSSNATRSVIDKNEVSDLHPIRLTDNVRRFKLDKNGRPIVIE